MQTYSIIEDLDWSDNFYKNHDQALTDLFLRNFKLIKRYDYHQQDLPLTKFKKQIIPRFINQVQTYRQLKEIKNRQQYYEKRRTSYKISIISRQHKGSLPELSKPHHLNRQYQLCPVAFIDSDDVRLKCQTSIFSQPNSLKDPIKARLSSKSSKQLSQKKCSGKLFNIEPVQLPCKAKNFPPKQTDLLEQKQKQNKGYSTIFNDSIDFCKKFLFKTSLDPVYQKKELLPTKKLPIDTTNFAHIFCDENSFEKKMMNALKQKKSKKNLKIKILSNYANDKNLGLNFNQKPNTSAKDSTHTRNFTTKQKIVSLGLKGKLCLLSKQRNSRSYIFTSSQNNFNCEAIQIIEPFNQLPLPSRC